MLSFSGIMHPYLHACVCSPFLEHACLLSYQAALKLCGHCLVQGLLVRSLVSAIPHSAHMTRTLPCPCRAAARKIGFNQRLQTERLTLTLQQWRMAVQVVRARSLSVNSFSVNSICLCLCLCLSLYVSISLCLSVSLSLCLSVSLSLCLCVCVCLSLARSLVRSQVPLNGICFTRPSSNRHSRAARSTRCPRQRATLEATLTLRICRYTFCLLYWYKRTNTDATHAYFLQDVDAGSVGADATS